MARWLGGFASLSLMFCLLLLVIASGREHDIKVWCTSVTLSIYLSQLHAGLLF